MGPAVYFGLLNVYDQWFQLSPLVWSDLMESG